MGIMSTLPTAAFARFRNPVKDQLNPTTNQTKRIIF